MIKEEVQEKIRRRTINSRNKGKSAEREVRDLIQPVVDRVFASFQLKAPEVQRNLMQSMVGGHDLLGTPGIAVEVKRHETLQLDKWWEQTSRQAESVHKIPVLIYRKSHARWRVRLMGAAGCGDYLLQPILVDIDILTFLDWYGVFLHRYLQSNKDKNL